MFTFIREKKLAPGVLRKVQHSRRLIRNAKYMRIKYACTMLYVVDTSVRVVTRDFFKHA